MLSSNTNFDTKHALANKTPMYLVVFDHGTSDVEWVDGTDTVFLDTSGVEWIDLAKYDYCDHKPTSQTNELKQYLSKISGLSQKVTPEEGRASIGGVNAEIIDANDEITALLATDTYYFHRKKTTIKAGYKGMAEADMLTIMTGWITGIKLDKAAGNYVFTITDPQKWMQRKIFRGSEDSTVTLSGNPLNILLSVLTSTGAGTNGSYDYLAAVNSLGIDEDYIDVSGIEGVRDDWFPGNSHYMSFSISERIKAKDFIEKEILKILNLYPVIDGQGRFSVKPFKPPLPTSNSQSVDKDSIIGMPQWDNNLTALANEVECHYDWNTTTEIYDTIDFYPSSTSITNRGPGKKPIVLKSKGLTTAKSGDDIMETRSNRIFERFAVPPVRISFNTFFSKWLVEAGDIISFTHPNMPDIEVGTRGLTAKRMEVISRSVDWRRGRVKIDLLDTGFGKGKYGVISPTMTVLSVTAITGSSETFYPVVSGDDGHEQPVGTFEEGATVLYFGGNGNNQAFIRFPSVTVPQGITLKAATLTGTAAAGNSGADLNVYLNDIDDAVAPTNLSELDALDVTDAVNWVTPGVQGTVAVPDVKTIVEDVVQRAGWESGNALMVIIRDNSGTSAQFSFRSVDFGSEAGLNIEQLDSCETFVVSAADAAKYANFTNPEVQLCDSKMRVKVAAKTLLTINTTTGVITCDDWGVTPVAGDIVLFANYDSCTTEQQDWNFIADSSDNLGAADDDAHLIVL